MTASDLMVLYCRLLESFGPQGWWPLSSLAGRGSFDDRGYHRGDFSYPRTAEQRFEIAMGAVLTQNTTWKNVEKVIKKLIGCGLLTPEAISCISLAELGKYIRASGYYNQKAKKLKILSDFFLKIERLPGGCCRPARGKLLALWGIGPETADSILLYVYKIPSFVIDAYTRRLAARLGLVSGGESYDKLQSLFTGSLPREYELYAEFHALIVRQAKYYCRKKPLCADCLLRSECNHFTTGQYYT
jgi:endonuclease-3 related protein